MACHSLAPGLQVVVSAFLLTVSYRFGADCSDGYLPDRDRTLALLPASPGMSKVTRGNGRTTLDSMSELHGDTNADARTTARIDLHCHSRFSARSELYLARTFGVRECFTDPHLVYREAKARGMTHVTLTDHDTIQGALQLVDYPDFTIGEEISAFFPTEALFVHILVWGLDETQHAEIGELRFNVFELTDYLRREGLPHALAHPL